MVEEASAAAGAVVAGRTVYDHIHGWGADPLFPMLVFVPTHRPHEVRVAGATTFTFVPDVRARTNPPSSPTGPTSGARSGRPPGT
jgi:dihydrofolate reductase